MTQSQTELQKAVERLHGCQATFREVVEVHERFGDRSVWDGLIYVFDIEGHPKASRCYAWVAETADPPGRKFYTVLGVPPIDSPEKALRAAIVRDYKKGKE